MSNDKMSIRELIDQLYFERSLFQMFIRERNLAGEYEEWINEKTLQFRNGQ